jgi:hypothetical protein
MLACTPCRFICPQPQDLKEDEDNGGGGWYEWNCEHWGTKWEASQLQLQNDEDDATIELSFETAWSPPISALDHWKTTNTYMPTTLKYIEHGCAFEGMWDDGEDTSDVEAEYESQCWTCVTCGDKHHGGYEEPAEEDANGPKCESCNANA